jgi:hypothetical protein
MHLQSTRKDSPLSRHSLKVVVHLAVITILRLRSASEIVWTTGLVGSFFDISFPLANEAEVPAASDADMPP